jgi:hypothetical protein
MTGGRRTRRIGASWLLLVALGVAGLSACTDDEPLPGPTSTRTTTATASPSPTVTPPTAPQAKPTRKSAEAFVQYFWDVHNYSYATLDTKVFSSISEPECKFCTSTVKDISRLRTADSIASGSAVRVIEAAAPPSEITTGIIVSTVISQDPGSITHRDGSVRTIPGISKAQSYIGLNWSGRRWLVDDVAIENPRKTS